MQNKNTAKNPEALTFKNKNFYSPLLINVTNLPIISPGKGFLAEIM